MVTYEFPCAARSQAHGLEIYLQYYLTINHTKIYVYTRALSRKFQASRKPPAEPSVKFRAKDLGRFKDICPPIPFFSRTHLHWLISLGIRIAI